MKTAVETIFVGRERAYNRRFLQMWACGLRGTENWRKTTQKSHAKLRGGESNVSYTK